MFDAQSGVPRTNCAHSTITDEKDVRIVLDTVLKNKLLDELGSRSHRAFSNMKLNPLFKWDMKKTRVDKEEEDRFLEIQRKIPRRRTRAMKEDNINIHHAFISLLIPSIIIMILSLSEK